MNKKIGMIGSIINVFTVFAFAICMLIHFDFGSYFVCLFLSLSFILMIASFEAECNDENRVAGRVATTFAGIYSTLILIVYFTQCTTVMNENLTGFALQTLNYKYMGLMFNLDLLGYSLMALSTFFIGLTINVKNKKDKILKVLLLVHGIFFISCLIMPMLGIFSNSVGSTSIFGIIALEIWCIYFLPIGVLSYFHFKEN